MDDGTLFTIGDLARRTGLPVRTIRFYSDSGLVPPTTRSPAGYRRYDLTALSRLDLVRTLRDLGVDLATVRRLLDREVTVADVAAAHARALDAQIRILRLRRAVLLSVARRGPTLQEVELVHRLARLSEQERHRIINDFVDATFEGLDADPEFVARMRQATPDLPDDPTPEQVEAWVELAELVQDPDFRARIRQMAENQAAQRAAHADAGSPDLHAGLVALVRERVGAAVEAGVDPAGRQAAPVVAEVAAAYAEAFGRTDGPELRAWLREQIGVGNDPRAERYWQLLAVVNGWPVPPTLTPMFGWLADALRHHPGG